MKRVDVTRRLKGFAGVQGRWEPRPSDLMNRGGCQFVSCILNSHVKLAFSSKAVHVYILGMNCRRGMESTKE